MFVFFFKSTHACMHGIMCYNINNILCMASIAFFAWVCKHERLDLIITVAIKFYYDHHIIIVNIHKFYRIQAAHTLKMWETSTMSYKINELTSFCFVILHKRGIVPIRCESLFVLSHKQDSPSDLCH